MLVAVNLIYNLILNFTKTFSINNLSLFPVPVSMKVLLNQVLPSSRIKWQSYVSVGIYVLKTKQNKIEASVMSSECENVA